MQNFVEQLVPSDALLKQGIYLQTCAHIELTAWRIVQMIEGVDPNSSGDVVRFLNLKLSTRSIIKRLKRAATQCHASLGIRILSLSSLIEDGLLNRNMAAHGAWRLHSSGKLEVEHYLRGKDKTYRYISERFTLRGIDATVEHADRLLREAVQIHDILLAGRRRFITHNASTMEKRKNQVIKPRIAQHYLDNSPKIKSGLAKPMIKLMSSTAELLGLANISS